MFTFARRHLRWGGRAVCHQIAFDVSFIGSSLFLCITGGPLLMLIGIRSVIAAQLTMIIGINLFAVPLTGVAHNELVRFLWDSTDLLEREHTHDNLSDSWSTPNSLKEYSRFWRIGLVGFLVTLPSRVVFYLPAVPAIWLIRTFPGTNVPFIFMLSFTMSFMVFLFLLPAIGRTSRRLLKSSFSELELERLFLSKVKTSSRRRLPSGGKIKRLLQPHQRRSRRSPKKPHR